MAAAIIMAWAVPMGCRAKQDQMPAAVTRPVKLATVTAGNARVIQSLPGKVRASRRAEMSFKVSGALQRFLVEQGQKVTQGQLMACIDPRDFDTQVKADSKRPGRGKGGVSRHENRCQTRRYPHA